MAGLMSGVADWWANDVWGPMSRGREAAHDPRAQQYGMLSSPATMDAMLQEQARMHNYGSSGLMGDAGYVQGPWDQAAMGIGMDAASVKLVNEATRLANFKKWFGDSKVVGKDGQPVTVYHGTNRQFDAFDTSDKSMDYSQPNPLGENIGAFFAVKRADAADFGPNVGAYSLALSNPKVFKTQEDFRAFMREHSGRAPDVRDAEGFILEEGKFYNNMRSAIENEGHDGVVILNSQYSSKRGNPWYVSFKPEQIKSVENRGTYDPQDPRFMYSAVPVGLMGSDDH